MPTPVPKGLKAVGRKLWRETTDAYDLRQDELEALRAACGEADLISRMEDELEDEPLTVTGSTGQIVAHPLISELRQHRTAMAGLLRGLKLPDDATAGETNQHRSAAQSKWASSYGKGA